MELLQFYYRRFAIHVRKTAASPVAAERENGLTVHLRFDQFDWKLVLSRFANNVHPRSIDNVRVEGDNRSAAMV